MSLTASDRPAFKYKRCSCLELLGRYKILSINKIYAYNIYVWIETVLELYLLVVKVDSKIYIFIRTK